MRRLFLLPLILIAAPARADDEAKKLADEILTKGASLFDARDTKGLAATYVDDAVFTFFSQDENSNYVKAEEHRGRTAIEDYYRKFFDGQTGATTAKNTVEYAHRLSTDVLLIHGHFRPDSAKDEAFPFVQIRVKQGDKWLIKSLQLFLLTK